MKFAYSTDWHSSPYWASHQIYEARNLGATVLLHGGDFGYNYNIDYSTMKEFNQKVLLALKDTGMTLMFIDGNHDNHEYLRSLPSNSSGMKPIPESDGRLVYIPRGTRWEMGGVTFAGVGGAYSLRPYRFVEGVSVFSDLECPTDVDINRLGLTSVDVLLTHEVPSYIHLPHSVPVTESDVAKGMEVRNQLTRLYENVTPKVALTGHWHRYFKDKVKTPNGHVYTHYILDREFTEDNLVVFDTDSLIDKGII